VSQENVEVVRTYLERILRNLRAYWDEPRSYATDFERGEPDPGSREVYELLDPDIRWTSAFGEVRTGKLGFAKMADELLAISAQYSLTLDAITDLGGDHVLGEWTAQLTGHSSGATGDVQIHSLFTLRDGLIREIVEYPDREAALKAVRLEASRIDDSFKPLRRIVEAYRRGDLETHMRSYAPDAVLDLSARGLGSFEGRAAIESFWRDYYRSFEDLSFELEEAIDLGHGVMFAVVRQDARPAESLGRVQTREAWVSVWEEGLLRRGWSYSDLDAARAAAERLAEERGVGSVREP
jgi:ketosteroid isomerase-like protein